MSQAYFGYIKTNINIFSNCQYGQHMCKQLTLSIKKQLHPNTIQSLLDSQGKCITPVECSGGSYSYIAKYYSLFQYIILPSHICLRIKYCIFSTGSHADMAAINFSLADFNDFTIFMPNFLTYFYISFIEHIYWIAGSILFVDCGVLC